ncbi:MAG: hypothetical protein KAI26_00715 [Nanoarchaeota archaeon]|nr:hypothetical protein [Nanoarchaeota archaeon]
MKKEVKQLYVWAIAGRMMTYSGKRLAEGCIKQKIFKSIIIKQSTLKNFWT